MEIALNHNIITRSNFTISLPDVFFFRKGNVISLSSCMYNYLLNKIQPEMSN